jgi:hypothetical protein
MAERGVSMHDIVRVISEHQVTFDDKKGNPCYVRELDGRRIKVVVAADDPDLVITVIDLDAE